MNANIMRDGGLTGECRRHGPASEIGDLVLLGDGETGQLNPRMDGTHNKIDLIFQNQFLEHLGAMGGIAFGVVINEFHFSTGNTPLSIEFGDGGLTHLVQPVAVLGGPYRQFLNHTDLDRFLRAIGKRRKGPGTKAQSGGAEALFSRNPDVKPFSSIRIGWSYLFGFHIPSS